MGQHRVDGRGNVEGGGRELGEEKKEVIFDRFFFFCMSLYISCGAITASNFIF
jgi:hypothetical protein